MASSAAAEAARPAASAPDPTALVVARVAARAVEPPPQGWELAAVGHAAALGGGDARRAPRLRAAAGGAPAAVGAFLECSVALPAALAAPIGFRMVLVRAESGEAYGEDGVERTIDTAARLAAGDPMARFGLPHGGEVTYMVGCTVAAADNASLGDAFTSAGPAGAGAAAGAYWSAGVTRQPAARSGRPPTHDGPAPPQAHRLANEGGMADGWHSRWQAAPGGVRRISSLDDLMAAGFSSDDLQAEGADAAYPHSPVHGRRGLHGHAPSTPPGPAVRYDCGIALAPRIAHQRTPSGGRLELPLHHHAPVAGAAVAEAASEHHAENQFRGKLAIVLVGLPGRGKTFTALKLQRYLRWLGHSTKHFNVGQYRRNIMGSHHPAEFFSPLNRLAAEARAACAQAAIDDMIKFLDEGGDVAIFDATNSTIARRDIMMKATRGKCRCIFLESICTDAEIVLKNVREKVELSPDYKDEHGGTSDQMEAAVSDFLERMSHYEAAYQTIGSVDASGVKEAPRSYIKMIDAGTNRQRMEVSRISGYLPGRIVTFLVNAHMQPRHVFLSRHGQSMANVSARIGGDSRLSPLGRAYARRLARWMKKRFGGEAEGAEGVASGDGAADSPSTASGRPPSAAPSLSLDMRQMSMEREQVDARKLSALQDQDHAATSDGCLSPATDGTPQPTPTGGLKPREALGDSSVPVMAHDEFTHGPYEGMSVWTSTLVRTISTAKYVDRRVPQVRWRALDEIDAGVCDGLTYDEIKEQMPEEYHARKQDKMCYRYPRGESYLDVVQRLEPVIIELERQRTPILIVAHQAVLRCLYAYFSDTPLEDMVSDPMPLNVLIELSPSQYGLAEKRHVLIDESEMQGKE